MTVLYERIRQRRQELNISQDELAQRLGYKSRSSINKIEKGENDIPQSKIIKFASALNTTPEFLMGWKEKSVSTPTDTPAQMILTEQEQNHLKEYRQLEPNRKVNVNEYTADQLRHQLERS